jgi:surface antigen
MTLTSQADVLDLNLNLEDKSALTRLTESDWKLLKETAKEALDKSSDGSSHVWKNKETSNAGVITILTTDKSDNHYCRNTRFINTAGELTSTTFVNLCNQQGKWAEESERSTSTASVLSTPNPSSSIMFNEPNASSDIKVKSLSKTSAKCKQLSAEVQRLEGNPLRRSVAMELYQAECQR